MGETNIDEFNEYVAKILNKLYSEFPKEISINPYDITKKLEKDQNEAFFGTMRFLKNEEFIRMNERMTYTNNYYDNVALTSKGLSILGATPVSLKPNETFIQKIRKSLKSGTKEVVTATIQELIKYSITSLTAGNTG